ILRRARSARLEGWGRPHASRRRLHASRRPLRGLLSMRAAGPGLEKATTSARSIPCALGAAIGFSERCRALGVFPSPLWGGVGVGVVVWGKIGASPAPPPSPTLPQPAAGLPASGKLKGDQTPAGRGLVGGGSRLSLPHVRTSFHKRAVVCS